VTDRPGWVDRLRSGFSTEFGGAAPEGVPVAPGRVNLIGEHTDYNDGWVLPMALALAASDLAEAGRLMDASHESLRDLYEVSSFELDLFTDPARRHPACHGARLTGAGFGGCAIALVSAQGAEAFAEEVHAAYRAEVDLPSSVFVCRTVSGARVVESSATR
jgi:galactokinase